MANALLYGFAQLKDIDLSERAITLDRDLMISAIELSREVHERDMNALVDIFCGRTTDPQLQFSGGGVVRSQPLDENGRSLPVKPPGPYTTGFPIWNSGNALGSNYVTSKKMTVQQVNDRVAMVLGGDALWMRDQILGALYRNTSLSVTDPQFGALTVVGLANGDTVTYGTTAGAMATDTHYAAQASAIDDSNNPFNDIYTELTEHPGNGSRVVSFINSAQAAAVQALAGFIDVLDPDLVAGNDDTRLARNSPGGFGLPGSATMLGKTDNVWVADWSSAIPSGYIVSVAIDAAQKPLLMREDPEAELRGFRAVAERNDFPYYEEQWFRRAGFGGWNRIAAHVQLVGASPYAVPTNYTVPMR